jgi:hypothetical protein
MKDNDIAEKIFGLFLNKLKTTLDAVLVSFQDNSKTPQEAIKRARKKAGVKTVGSTAKGAYQERFGVPAVKKSRAVSKPKQKALRDKYATDVAPFVWSPKRGSAADVILRGLGKQPLNKKEMANVFGIPMRTVQGAVMQLVECGRIEPAFADAFRVVK